MTFLYFGYGSNMKSDRICHEKRCPSATKIPPTNGSQHLIKGWKFSFSKYSNWWDDEGNGKGNVEETKKSEDKVYGVIFEIKDEEKEKLTDIEKGYDQKEEWIFDEKTNKKVKKAAIYFKKDFKKGLRPLDWYQAYIVEGAEENKLPKSYIKKLKTVKPKTDGHPEKRNGDEEMLKKYGYNLD